MPGKRALSGGGRAYVGFWFHCSPNPNFHTLKCEADDENRSLTLSFTLHSETVSEDNVVGVA